MDMTPQTWPEWYDGRHINEVLFCQQFLDKHPMKCVRGRLFTVDGLIEDEGQIGNLILEEISGVLTANLSKTVANLLASIKLQAYSPPLPIETDRIHVANGTYFMDGSFSTDRSYCNNRLTVTYNPDAPTPKKWLQFLLVVFMLSPSSERMTRPMRLLPSPPLPINMSIFCPLVVGSRQ